MYIQLTFFLFGVSFPAGPDFLPEMPGARIGTGFSCPKKLRIVFFTAKKVRHQNEPVRAIVPELLLRKRERMDPAGFEPAASTLRT
jgi:hypothetical protein